MVRTLSRCKGTHVVRVSFESQVPALTYGGPKTAPDEPSPESTKVSESLVILEFIADLFPSAGIFPADPVKRAQARFFIEGVSSKFVPAWFAAQFRHGPVDDLYVALEYLQSLLPAESGFAVGEFSAADIAIAPFLARMRITFLNDLGAYPEGEGPKIYAEITGSRFARLAKYQEDLFARESFKATFDEVRVLLYLLMGLAPTSSPLTGVYHGEAEGAIRELALSEVTTYS